MLCLVLLVHMQEPWLLLWNITRAQLKSSQKQTGACISQPCNGNRLESKILPCNAGCVKSLQTKHSDFLLVIHLLQSQPPCLNACEPFTVYSRSTTHGSQTLQLFIVISGHGGWCFFIFKPFVSFQLFVSCSGGRYCSDPLCLAWEASRCGSRCHQLWKTEVEHISGRKNQLGGLT